MSLEAHGSIGPRLTFSNRASGQQVRFQNRQVDVNTSAQQTQRGAFLAAVAAWNELTSEQQRAYDDEAKSKGLNMTGYNLYLRQNIGVPWLGTWKKRIEITIDNSKIDSDLDWFPVPIILGTSVGQYDDDVSAIFDEVGSNWQKIAVTKADAETQLYVEKEQWDNENTKAVLWVSKSDFTLSSSSTTLYIYYDNSKANNTTYVADVGSRPEVWDNNFKAVYHLRESGDGTADEFVDSTSNNNDGQGGGGDSSKTPTQANAKVGKGQDFDGSDDYVGIPTATIPAAQGDLTFSAWIKNNDVTNWRDIITTGRTHYDYLVLRLIKTTGCLGLYYRNYSGGTTRTGNVVGATNLSDNAYHHVVGIYDYAEGKLSLYLNGAVHVSPSSKNMGTTNWNLNNMVIGINSPGLAAYPWDGTIDEARISSSARAAAWIKADYYAQTDDLLSYGPEEEK